MMVRGMQSGLSRWIQATSVVLLLTVSADLVRFEDLESYHRNGHVITPSVVNQTAILALGPRMRQLFAKNGRQAFGDESGNKEVSFTFGVHELDDVIADFLRNEIALWEMARELSGAKGSLCVLMDRGFSKDPGDLETHWHRDDEAVGLAKVSSDIRTIHAWIPLTAMGRDLGTLRYVPGSHREGWEKHGWLELFLASIGGFDLAYWALSAVAQDDKMVPGDVSWHDGGTLHSAGANEAGGIRDGYAVSFAYCKSENKCEGLTERASKHAVTCHAADRLFDAAWLKRHREGENEYSKHAIEKPITHRIFHFTWRSIVGAVAGLLVHHLVTYCFSGKNS